MFPVFEFEYVVSRDLHQSHSILGISIDRATFAYLRSIRCICYSTYLEIPLSAGISCSDIQSE